MAIEINIPANGTNHLDLPTIAPFTHYAQSFQDAGGFLLDTISMGFANGAGDAGNIVCSIYLADGNGFPTGDVLESDSYPVSSLTTYPTYTTVSFTFTTVTITPATSYCFVITTTAGSSPTNFVYFKESAASSYSGGHSSHYYNGGWVTETVDIISVIRSVDNPELSGTIEGTSSLSGVLEEPTERLYPPGPIYWYSTGSYHYQLLVQSDFTLGNPPPTGVENTDYVILASTYLPNFIRTNRRLVAAARNNLYYEDI